MTSTTKRSFSSAAAVDDQTSDGPVGFGSISLSPEDLARFGRLLGGARPRRPARDNLATAPGGRARPPSSPAC